MDYRQITGIPAIPETVTVHLGAPSSSSANVVISFPDYIKNVASSEIYPTWPDAALRANIYAQISFALNRIFTEYYRSRGYSFDITSDTSYDQSFVNGREIFENISLIVDEIFNSYIRRINTVEPLFAQYCNGTTTTCNGLSQWGSVELADQGLGAFEILQNYFGNDIELVTNVPIRGLTPGLPAVPLTLGSIGNDVAILQSRLNRVSTNYPNIPKISNATGVFDQETERAVREFQKTFDLAIDGVVYTATWYELLRVYNAVKRLNELNSEGETLEDIPIIFPEILQIGDVGNSVRIIQYYLDYVAQYQDTVPSIEIDGFFGTETETAVKDFQLANELEATGIVDEQTFNILYDTYLGIINSLPDEQFQNSARPYPGKSLVLGVEGEDALLLQQYLNTIAASYPDIPSVNETGIYDEETEAAIRVFQEINNLPVTGVTAANTWFIIAEQYDNLRAGSYLLENQWSSE